MNTAALYLGYASALVLAMLAIYAVAVQIERGGLWQIFSLVAIPALFMSWGLNQTLGRLIYGKPAHWRETFSKHTERRRAEPGMAGRWARLFAALLNFFAHNERHVK